MAKQNCLWIDNSYRVFFWEIAVKIPSQKTHSGNSNLRFPGKILYIISMADTKMVSYFNLDFQDGSVTAALQKLFNSLASSLFHVEFKPSFFIWRRKRYGKLKLIIQIFNDVLAFSGMLSDVGVYRPHHCHGTLLFSCIHNNPLYFHKKQSQAQCPSSFKTGCICLQIIVHR